MSTIGMEVEEIATRGISATPSSCRGDNSTLNMEGCGVTVVLKSFTISTTGEKEEAELSEWATALRSGRKAKIEEVASFSPEFIEANLDRWCAESEEVFASHLEEWAAISTPKTEAGTENASLHSAIKNVRPVEKEEGIAVELANFLSFDTKV